MAEEHLTAHATPFGCVLNRGIRWHEISNNSWETKETSIQARAEFGRREGEVRVDTGIGFLDHMLHAMAFYAGFGLDLTARGDLNVDGHHTVEDTGIVLGQAIREALGDKRGIRRFGSAYVPMDEGAGLYIAGFLRQGVLVFDADMPQERIGDL